MARRVMTPAASSRGHPKMSRTLSLSHRVIVANTINTRGSRASTANTATTFPICAAGTRHLDRAAIDRERAAPGKVMKRVELRAAARQLPSRSEDGAIRNSSSDRPSSSALLNQRGLAPRPPQVLPLGPRYFGAFLCRFVFDSFFPLFTTELPVKRSSSLRKVSARLSRRATTSSRNLQSASLDKDAREDLERLELKDFFCAI
jgi:hypothetical protein